MGSKFGSGAGRWGRLCLSAMVVSAGMVAAAESKLDFSGYAWTQYQNGLTPMYNGGANFDYNPFMSIGGMVFLGSHPSENWSTNLSVGVGFGNSAIRKSIRDTSNQLISKTNPHSISLGMGGFLHEANIAYHTDAFRLKIGRFHYTYSDYNHNLGLYLLRGPVYPGFLYSGFDDIAPLTKSGVMTSWSPMEALTWDVIGSFETDFKPFMDINLSSFLTFRAGPLEFGAGVEAQRLVEFNPCITSPTNGDDVEECLGGDAGSSYVGAGGVSADLYEGAFFVIDTTNPAAPDTTSFSLGGTKVMARAAFDFKKVLSAYAGSPKDFVLYFEAALIGVKDYKYLYEKKGERIPVLVGMNVPTFGLLDLFSVEVEYYNSPYQNDPYKLVGTYDVFEFSEGNSINFAMSPIPPSNKARFEHLAKAQEDFDPKQDNLKWSLFAAKTIHEKITFKAQIASDHWRVPNNNFVMYEASSNPGQFYGSLKVAYGL